MTIFITCILFLLVYIFDYKKIKKQQNKQQNIMYLIIFYTSVTLIIISEININIPSISSLIRSIS